MVLLDKILALTRRLYPTGRAFKMPLQSDFEKLHRALAQSEARLYADVLSTLDSALPDNNNFDVNDASDWEQRLGLITNTAVSLSDRKLAIIRKMNHPGTIKARQHYLYIQSQLQAAGFAVYIYENRFPDGMGGYVTQTPEEFSVDPLPFFGTQLNDRQLGDFQLGGVPGNKIVNSIYSQVDNIFVVGDNLRSTFFIGGSTPGTFADVPAIREVEFRQLILKLKPAQTVGFLLINYI